MAEFDAINDPSGLLEDFFGSGSEHTFASLTPGSLDRATILKANFGRATTALDTKRSNFLTDFGLNADESIDPNQRFGQTQNTLREGGSFLDQFEGRSASRGFAQGSGLARSGAEQGRAAERDTFDILGRDLKRQQQSFDQERGDLFGEFAFELGNVKQENILQKIADEDFTDEIEEPPAPAKAAAPAAKAPSPGSKLKGTPTQKAGQFARAQLLRYKKAGVFKGSIPKKPKLAAAKFRKVNAKLTPAQRKKLKKVK
jgi:hypothetical protein